jgi:hypothetical protein
LPANENGAIGPFGSQPAASGASTPPGKESAGVIVKEVKMSAIFGPGDDAEITPWTPARARSAMAAFKASDDDEESEPDEETSVD